ncbi:MAG: glycosyltransferase [Hyphomicrobiaceae bacterium]
MHAPTVFVLSLSHIPRDGRVRRHCRRLTEAGCRVVAIGLGPTDGEEPIDTKTAARHITIAEVAWSAIRRIQTAVALSAARAPLTDSATIGIADAIPGVRGMRLALDHAIRTETPRTPVIVANDWTTLPAALEAHARWQISIHYDTHELATEEHIDRAAWRLLFPPVIRKIERLGATAARSISCVSPSISAIMSKEYGLSNSPIVIPNLPDNPPIAPSPVGTPVTVLYHGIFTSNRGLEALIRSVSEWPNGFRLVLRGAANSKRVSAQIDRAVSHQTVAHRVALEPMAPQNDVVTLANKADIGIFLPDLSLRQNRYALPNKLFEYLYAGLLPIVPANTDMADVLSAHGIGAVVPGGRADALPALLAALTPDEIVAAKSQAYQASINLHASSTNRGIVEILERSHAAAFD